MTNKLLCGLNCGGDNCNGECDTWNEIKSSLILLKKYLPIFDIDNLLKSLDADKRLIKHAKRLCLQDFSSTLQDDKRDSASGMDYVDILSGYEFELLIVELYNAMGFSLKQTAKTRDGGIDITAERNKECLLIQCKRYSPNKKVSVNVVRELFGTINASPKSTVKGIIVSTTGFTKPAKDFAAISKIQVLDRIGLEKMLNEYFPGELPGFKIEPGIRVVSDNNIEATLMLTNTSKRPMTYLHVFLKLFNDCGEKIGEVFPYKSINRLGIGKTWKYEFSFVPHSRINYYRISIEFKRNSQSQIITRFQGSKHYL